MEKEESSFGLLSILYSIFFCFCFFKNAKGITSPIFWVVSIIYFLYYFKKNDLKISKKETCFYSLSIFLLALSNFLTASSLMVFYNGVAILLLLSCFLIKPFYDTRKWDFTKYLSSVLLIIVRSLGKIGAPFISLNHYIKSKAGEKSKVIYSILLGLVISIPLLLIVGGLLLSADAVFKHVTESILDGLYDFINIPNYILTAFLFVCGLLLSFCSLAELSTRKLNPEMKDKKTMDPVIAITFTSIITIVYLFFSFVQIFSLFLKQMDLPENYTYAEYAREGFFQLLFVCLINLALVLFCKKHYKDNKILKAILSVICFCTYIMIASSTYRMILYIQAYYLTFTRLFVLLALFVITLCLTGILVSIYKEDIPLFSYMLVVVTVCFVLFSISKPDYWIAKYNIVQGGSEKGYDISYMFELSIDAAPALKEAGFFDGENIAKTENLTDSTSRYLSYVYPENAKNYMLYIQGKYQEMNYRTLNLSTYIAYQQIKDQVITKKE